MNTNNTIQQADASYKNAQPKLSYHLKVLTSRHPILAFKEIPANIQGFILLDLPKKLQGTILRGLKNPEIINFLRFLDDDDIAVLAVHLTAVRRKTVLTNLIKYERDKASFLVRYKPDTAGSLVSLDYIIVYQKATFSEVKEKISKHLTKKNSIPTILVTNRGQLAGILPLVSLFTTKEKFILPFIKPAKTIKEDQDQEEILQIFDRNDHENIVVMEKDNSILGVIKTRDLVHVAQNEATEDLFGFAGVQKDENALDSIGQKVQSRYKWLIINLGTAFLAAWVVSLFGDIISKTVILAAYMPIIAGMGGNTATQTLAVVTRGIALNQINFKTAGQVIFKEASSGLVNGVINGLLVALIATFFNQRPLLGFVAGTAMIFNLLVAGFFGALIPVILKQLKVDPAVASTIFVTTCTDVFGFFAFLGLATLIL